MRNLEKDAIEMEERRQAMLNEGFRLFSEKMIETISMQDVADASGVGVATLYRYYKTKPELVIAIGAKKWREYNEKVEERSIRCGVEKMNAAQEFNFYLDSYIELYTKYKDILRFNRNFDSYILHENISPEQMKEYNEGVQLFVSRFHRLYEKALRDDTLRTDISEKKLFAVTMRIMLSLSAKYAEGLLYKADDESDMTDELLIMKNMIMKEYVIETGE